MHYAKSEVERIARRFPHGDEAQQKLCSVDKANVLDTSILWRSGHRDRQAVSGRSALAHVCRQRGDAAGARAEAVRRDCHGNIFGDILSD